MVFFFNLDLYLSPCQQSRHHRHPHVNEIAVADTDKAYSNTQNTTSCKKSKVIDLLHHPRHLIRSWVYLWNKEKILVIRQINF